MTTAKTIARLRILGDALPNISSGTGDGMEVFLEEPGSPMMVARIGTEILTARRHLGGPSIDLTRGPTYTTTRGQVTGGRYLMREAGSGSAIIGALNYTLMGTVARGQAVLSNICVAATHRRQGIANRLLEEFLSDFPSARADSSMTSLGAAFLGYATNEPAPAHSDAAQLRKAKP